MIFHLITVLGLISSMRLDGKKDIQFVKLAWSVLHAKLKSYVLPPISEINRENKTNITGTLNVITVTFAQWRI